LPDNFFPKLVGSKETTGEEESYKLKAEIAKHEMRVKLRMVFVIILAITIVNKLQNTNYNSMHALSSEFFVKAEMSWRDVSSMTESTIPSAGWPGSTRLAKVCRIVQEVLS